MKYLGIFHEQNIPVRNGWLKHYAFTKEEKREVILYYTFEHEQCLVLKQVGICAEITETYSTYWVFLLECISDNFDDFIRIYMEIVENRLLPYIRETISGEK